MRILVLQHVAVEHPGIFRDFFLQDGSVTDTVELDAGDNIPTLASYDLMLVMGGPQDVWQEDAYPWLVAEKAAIRKFVVEMRRPFLGICLGHQLLAAAIGGRVAPAVRPEVGIMGVSLSEAARDDALLHGLSDPLTVLQWHSSEVVELPPGCEILASSCDCAIQAYRYGQHAYGLQFHVEVGDRTVSEWADIPEYASALEKIMGAGAVERLRRATIGELPIFRRNAVMLHRNLAGIVADWQRAIPRTSEVA
jgi:GMP synthase-like glutamine amidotransferase